jgi:hypothetical protein
MSPSFVGCSRQLGGCRDVSSSLHDYLDEEPRFPKRLANNAPHPHASAIPYGNQAGQLLVGFENPRNVEMTRSAPNIIAWSCGRWPAIRMATSAPPKLAAVANARWTETSAVDVGSPALPSGIPCMRSSATTAASQYPIAAMNAPVTTPPMLLKANVSRVVKRAV